jgi:hypothetical protein
MYEYKHVQVHLHGLDQALNEHCQPPWQLCAVVQTLQGVLLVIIRKRNSEELGESPARRPAGKVPRLPSRASETGEGDAVARSIAPAVERRRCEQCKKAPALVGFRFCADCRPEGYEKCSRCDTDVPKGMVTPLCMACSADKARLPLP